MEGDRGASTIAFLSHSHVDTSLCLKIAQGLREIGVDVWLDEDSMTLSENIPTNVSIQIARCTVFIAVLSPAAVQSKWVELEVSTAIALHKDIVVALAAPLDALPESLTLLTAYKRLRFWGASFEESMRRIASTFRHKPSDLVQAKGQWKAHTGPTFDIDWSPDGEILAASGADGSVRLLSGFWTDSVTSVTLADDHAQWLTKVRWSPDGVHLVASGADRRVWIWNAITHTCEYALPLASGEILALGWSSSGVEALSSDGWAATLEGTTWKERARAQIGPPTAAAYGRNSATVAISYAGGQLEIASTAASHRLSIDAERVHAVAWNQSNTAIAFLTGGGRVSIVDASTGVATHELETEHSSLRKLCWTATGDMLVAGDTRGILHVLRATDGVMLHELNTGLGPVTHLAIGVGHHVVCTAHESGTVSMWELEHLAR